MFGYLHKIRAFTLIEMLITIFLLSVGVVVLMRMMSLGIFADTDVENVTIALNLAQEKMEYLKNLDFDHSDLDSNNSPFAEDISTEFAFVTSRDWTVTLADGDGDGNPDSDLKDVLVTINWTVKGESLSVELRTLIAKITN